MGLHADNSLNMTNRMSRMLSPGTLGLIRRIGRMADIKGCKAYLAGGFVRDLLIGVKNLDLDIAVEGDGPAFAAYASRKMGASLVVHKKFGTASLIMRKGPRIKIDIATARRESYNKPGALPSVEFSSIKNDLRRRDFTINAMAVSVNREDFGRLLDSFGGVKDIAEKRIRALHEKSFIDDPTRVFRAVRFEQRYGFKIDRSTGRLIKNAVKREMFRGVSGERLREEIVLLLKEKEPLKVIKRMKALDELRFINPKIRFGAGEAALCGNISREFISYGKYFAGRRPMDLWLVYFMAMINALSLGAARGVCERFVMSRNDRRRIISAKISANKIARLLSAEEKIKPSRIYRALEGLSHETILFITAKCKKRTAKNRIRRFLDRYRGTRTHIDGSDLKRMGIRPGPSFAKILKKTLYARMDGLISTKQDELAFAAKLL